MKIFRFSLFLVSLFTIFCFDFLYAQSQGVRRYYPIEDGYKWVYELIKEKKSETGEVEIAGKEYVGGVETVKMHDKWGYDCIATDEEGVKLYKKVEANGEYEIYNPPSVKLPFNIEEEVKSFKQEVSNLEYNSLGQLETEGSSSEEIWFMGKEDVVVPAGSFKNCLKFFTVSEWRDKDGSFGEDKIETWLARDIGPVKMIIIETEYVIEKDEVVDVNVDIEERRLKKAILGNKIYGE